jgi:hypothetical protein
VVEEDLKKSVVNNWKTKAANRMEWRSITGDVKAGTRLKHPYENPFVGSCCVPAVEHNDTNGPFSNTPRKKEPRRT